MPNFKTDAMRTTTWQGIEIADHFGDPVAEEKALWDGPAFAELTGLGVIAVTGPEAAGYLQRQLTCDVKGFKVGDSHPGAALRGNGTMVAEFTLHRSGEEEFLLVCPPICAEPLLEHLDKFCFGEKVTFERRTPAIVTVFEGKDAEREGIGTQMFGALGFHVLLEPSEVQLVCAALIAKGFRPVGLQALQRARIGSGIPMFGEDHDETWIPNDAGIAHVNDYEKGCFPGQEVVAKMHNIGHPRLVLHRFGFHEGDKPEPGMALYAEDGQAGTLTSVVELDSGLAALGHVKWKYNDSEAHFKLADREGSAGSAIIARPVG